MVISDLKIVCALFNFLLKPYVVPMIHGTSEGAIESICLSGFNAVGETDLGYYGSGMYFSSSHFYASKYATALNPNHQTLGGSKPFVICMVLPGNVYPVTEPPYLDDGSGNRHINNNGFVDRGCKHGYQSHYTIGIQLLALLSLIISSWLLNSFFTFRLQ